jgi:hypothetical protein
MSDPCIYPVGWATPKDLASMKFTHHAPRPHGRLEGTVDASLGKEADLCRSYRVAALQLFAADCVDVHPVVLDPWPFDERVPLRRVYDDVNEGASRYVFDQNSENLVVALPPGIADSRPARTDMMMMVIMDLATWTAEEAVPDERLSFADTEIKRAAIAARFLRAAEGNGLIGGRDAAQGYLAICATAMEGLASRRHGYNGEVLLAREAPGVATLLNEVVGESRRSAAPLLPMNPFDEAQIALQAVENSVSTVALPWSRVG